MVQGMFHEAKANVSFPLLLGPPIKSLNTNNTNSQWAFPAGKYNRIPSSPNLSAYKSFGDFKLSADRLAFIDGDQDVWNGLCYHSPLAPARTETSDLRPELLITGAGHHWDSTGIQSIDAEPQFIREAHLWEIRTVKKWLKEFGSWKPSKKPHGY